MAASSRKRYLVVLLAITVVVAALLGLGKLDLRPASQEKTVSINASVLTD